MHLESLKIVNYRKFRTEENVIHFVEPCSIEDSESKEYSGIGPSTTLIIGKNNVGKTTIVNALKMLCESSQPKAADFNMQYLSGLFDDYSKGVIEKYPELEFKIIVNVDFENNDLVSVLDEFMTLQNNNSGKKNIEITVKVEVSEQAAFSSAIKKIIEEKEFSERGRVDNFNHFYDLLDQNSDYLKLEESKKLFEIKYYDLNNRNVSKFTLKKLINLKEIKANRHLKEGVLSDIFNKIISFQFDNDEKSKGQLKKTIHSINKDLTANVDKKSDNVSSVLEEIEGKNHVGLKLLGNVTYDGLIKNLIKYNFSDNGEFIPESQFGLGYINLLNIIGEIIHYVDSYENGSQNSRINLLFIEEPEVFMHPQMQEFFIKRIDDAVKRVLCLANENVIEGVNNKSLNCQITITTHSSHIVNSKIHSSNSFNNINYVTVLDKSARVINLNDHVISKGIIDGTENESERDNEKIKNNIDDLKFIKKHIKYKVSELFFSDAVIFVEGATEETLLQYYLEKEDVLSKFYISVFNINGAHGKVYFPLIKSLKIPCLVITDLDIKRSCCQKKIKHKIDDENCIFCGHKKNKKDTAEVLNYLQYSQIDKLSNYTTTNQTIIFFNKKHCISEGGNHTKYDALKNIEYFIDDNIHVVFQKESIEGYYATSLEEAFILSNLKNDILKSSLKNCLSDKAYNELVGVIEENEHETLKSNSFQAQRKLANSKSDFSNQLLYECITSNEQNIPKLPSYIVDGFKWLNEELNGTNIQEEA